MVNPESDPVDHDRTTRQHAGEAMKNGTNAIGILGVAIGVVALITGLFAIATGHTAGAVGIVVGVLALGGGLAWLRHAHRQVREAELHWHEAHSDKPAPPPTS